MSRNRMLLLLMALLPIGVAIVKRTFSWNGKPIARMISMVMAKLHLPWNAAHLTFSEGRNSEA